MNIILQLTLDAFLKFIRIIFSKDGNNNGNLLIISLHKIGDSVFTIPAIKEIINSHKYEQIFLVVYSETKIIFNEVLNVQNIVTLNKRDFLFGNRIATSNARRIIKKNNPGILIDLTGTITSASLIFNLSTKQIIGMNDVYFKNIYSDFIEKGVKPHLVDRYCDVAELFTKKIRDKYSFEYPINYINNGIILIHPFAGWPAKEWGLNKYIALTERLIKNFDTSLIFQKGEFKEEQIEYLQENNIKFLQTNSLEELIYEIKKCALFIGNDSGPLYLASYFGKPTFTVYGPTNPDYSKPFGNFHQQIRKILKCSPFETQYCYLEAGRKCPSNECMFLLDLVTVENRVLEFIDKLKIISNINPNESEVKN